MEDNDDDEDDPVIVVCQGPPICRLTGIHALMNQEAGCIWCKVITFHDDGTETVEEPSLV